MITLQNLSEGNTMITYNNELLLPFFHQKLCKKFSSSRDYRTFAKPPNLSQFHATAT